MLVSVISIFTLFSFSLHFDRPFFSSTFLSIGLYFHRLFFPSAFFSIGCFFSRLFFPRPFFPSAFFSRLFFPRLFFPRLFFPRFVSSRTSDLDRRIAKKRNLLNYLFSIFLLIILHIVV